MWLWSGGVDWLGVVQTTINEQMCSRQVLRNHTLLRPPRSRFRTSCPPPGPSCWACWKDTCPLPSGNSCPGRVCCIDWRHVGMGAWTGTFTKQHKTYIFLSLLYFAEMKQRFLVFLWGALRDCRTTYKSFPTGKCFLLLCFGCEGTVSFFVADAKENKTTTTMKTGDKKYIIVIIK